MVDLKKMNLKELHELERIINKFKESQDYIDISYMIDHIKNIDLRLDVLKSLGYNIGITASKKEIKEKLILIGKKNEIRFQITPKYKNSNFSYCVVIKEEEFYFQK